MKRLFLPLLVLLTIMSVVLARASQERKSRALGLAVLEGDLQRTIALLESGADADSMVQIEPWQEYHVLLVQRQPLIVIAARMRRSDLAFELLRAGANPDAVDSDGCHAILRLIEPAGPSPEDYAEPSGERIRLLEMLGTFGASIDLNRNRYRDLCRRRSSLAMRILKQFKVGKERIEADTTSALLRSAEALTEERIRASIAEDLHLLSVLERT